MSDDLNSSSVTLEEVVREQDRIEECANAVLGGSDDTNCTYDKGYINRQALYACMDCCKEGFKGGVCLACALDCHEGHNLVELYTKRNFRCDCGNSRMKSSCKLNPVKEVENSENLYNQNFSGLYCTCSRPYPDPEREDEEEEMIQCVICEDWIHQQHCGVQLAPDCTDYEDFTCGACLSAAPLLAAYGAAWGVVEPLVEVEETAEEGKSSEQVNAGDKRGLNGAGSPPTKRPRDSCATQLLPAPWHEGDECRLRHIRSGASKRPEAVFWPGGWREALCRCTECLPRYSEEKLHFLLDPTDSMSWYEGQAKQQQSPSTAAQGSSTLQRGMRAFSQMDRVQQIELAAGYNSMKEELNQHLRILAESKKVVTQKDIEEFFANLKEKKAGPSFQYNCK